MHLKSVSLTFVILIVNVMIITGRGRIISFDVDPNVEIKIKFKDFNLKTVCEEEEWKHQFEPIKEKFAKCLGLKKIIMDDDDSDVDADRLSFFRGENHNPYCRIAKTWDGCTHHLKGLNCIESSAADDRSHGYIPPEINGDANFDPDNINAMTRVYKMQCDMAKLASNYGPFGSHGYGMDYFGGYGMPPEIDPEGMPPEGDL